jgi:hypothetical protein
MFKAYRQARSFQIIKADHDLQMITVQDQLSGLKIEVPYGPRELRHAEFIGEYELRIAYSDDSEKMINLLMQGY